MMLMFLELIIFLPETLITDSIGFRTDFVLGLLSLFEENMFEVPELSFKKELIPCNTDTNISNEEKEQ